MSLLAAAVCDTHALLLHAGGDARLGQQAAAHFTACEARNAIIYVPVVVLWEIDLLTQRGHIDLGRPLAAFTEDLFSNPAYHPVEISLEHVLLAAAQQSANDPFAALIAAAAQQLGLPLLTGNTQIAESASVQTVW